jgi:UDP-N-acetylglucosamine--dolichyl-phosphate N-acetylglucosaminephosphotransferase
LILGISSAISFLGTYLTIPRIIRGLRHRGITGIDLHKRDKPTIPTMGGVTIAGGYFIGMLFMLAFFNDLLIPITSAASSILMICMIGMIDDILDLSQRTRVILPVIASFPLMVATSTDRSMLIPLIGSVRLGIMYPLVIVPIGVVVASNLTNMLGGLNGLETGMGSIAVLSLLISAWISSKWICILILIPMLGALLAFLPYNLYPARIFIGNSGTYLIGAVIAAAVILGDMEMIGVISLLPYIVEFFIKANTLFQGECFSVLNSDGTLTPPNPEKIESLTHLMMNLRKGTEKEIVTRFWLLEVLVGLLSIITAYLSLYYFIFKS